MLRQTVTRCVLAVAILGRVQDLPQGLTASGVQGVVGTDVMACGRVVTYGCDKPTDMVLLDLKDPTRVGYISIGVPAAQRAAFGERFEERYLGAEVCATGRLEMIDRRYVIVAAAPESLSMQKPAPQAAAPFAPGALPLCTPGVEIPVLTREVKPEYSPAAMRDLIQGTVALEAVVLRDGNVGDVRVIHSLDSKRGLDQEAIRAAKKWRFKPGTLRGEPVPVIIRIDLMFNLK